MSGNRWHTWGAAAPLWGAGLILILLGISLAYFGLKQVRS